MGLKRRNINTGVTSLIVQGKTLNLTFGEKEVKVHLDGDSSLVWVDGVRYSCSGSPEIQVRVAPIKYLPKHFADVNKLVTEQYYSQDAAIKDVSVKYGFVYENFRRQYYERGGNKIRPVAG
jgi:hypothetical protein